MLQGILHGVLPKTLLVFDKSVACERRADAHACRCSLEAVTALMNEGVERLGDTLARIGKQGADVNIWRQFGTPFAKVAPPVAYHCVKNCYMSACGVPYQVVPTCKASCNIHCCCVHVLCASSSTILCNLHMAPGCLQVI